jgi:tRNA C32,U32 (ribose-2'-O)-methylase TrmJ
MLRVRKILGRAQLEREDINMLHGLIREIQKGGISRDGLDEEED